MNKMLRELGAKTNIEVFTQMATDEDLRKRT